MGQRKFLFELGLSQKDDLDQFFVLGLQIREHADFLKDGRCEVLRLVDDDDDVMAVAQLFNEISVQLGNKLRFGTAGVLDVKIFKDGAQQVLAADMGVGDQGRLGARVELVQKRAADGGLAGADVAGNDDKALAGFNGIDQCTQGLHVLAAFVEKPRTGRHIERRFFEAVEFVVHNFPWTLVNG